MRIVIAALFAALISSAGPAHAAGWNVEKQGVDTGAKGCSLSSDHEFLCLEVLCSAGQPVTLRGWLTGEILEGDFTLHIDGKPFPVHGGKHALLNGASRTELSGDMDGIFAAMKSGAMLVVDYPDLGLEADFAKVPLRGSSRAIGAVEAACATPAAVQVSGGELLRDASGKVSIGKLNNSSGCAFARTTGKVEKVRRDGPGGSIDGMTFLDDKYGSGFINVDTLKAGPDLQARRATLDYLLTGGRRLSIGVHGCGAAGRIEKLFSATER